MIVIAAVVFGAALLGLVTNWFVHERLEEEHREDGVDLGKAESWASGVLGPSVTLLALFLAFVLAGAATSYSDARSATTTEAATIEDFYSTAAYVQEPYRAQLKAATICYARAVAGPDWNAMKDGGGGFSRVPDVWTGVGRDGLRRIFSELRSSNPMFRTLTTADRERADSRRTRLTEASPAIPGILIAFLVAVIAAVVLYHAVTSPPRSLVHIFATVFAVGTMLAALSVIHELDRPFSGAVRIEVTPIRDIAHDLSTGFVKDYGAARVPCDADGEPTGSAS